jgi:hypothetical protein
LCTNEKAHPKPFLPRPSGDELLGFLTQTTPENHGYESVFWTTAILAHLITEKYKVAYKSKRPFYLLFQEAQFSFHTPGSVYTKRDEVKVKAWQEALKTIMNAIPHIPSSKRAPHVLLSPHNKTKIFTRDPLRHWFAHLCPPTSLCAF